MAVLVLLDQERGDAVSRDRILHEMWGIDYLGTTRTRDQLVVKLRQKLEPDTANPLACSPCMAAATGWKRSPRSANGVDSAAPAIPNIRMKNLLLALGFCFAGLLAPFFAAPLADIPFETKDGKTATLEDYVGKVVLVVNVASKCGHTKQYPALEQLYRKYGPEKFTVLGFPANDFGGQEPGTNEEIQQFCTGNYGITFPILAKVHVKGPAQAPLYAALTGPGAAFPGDVKWNFGKFLIGKDGTVMARFEPATKPDDSAIVAAVESALKE